MPHIALKKHSTSDSSVVLKLWPNSCFAWALIRTWALNAAHSWMFKICASIHVRVLSFSIPWLSMLVVSAVGVSQVTPQTWWRQLLNKLIKNPTFAHMFTCSLPKGLDHTLHVQALLRAWSKEGISGISKDHVRHMKDYKGNSALQRHVQVQVHFTWEWRRNSITFFWKVKCVNSHESLIGQYLASVCLFCWGVAGHGLVFYASTFNCSYLLIILLVFFAGPFRANVSCTGTHYSSRHDTLEIKVSVTSPFPILHMHTIVGCTADFEGIILQDIL